MSIPRRCARLMVMRNHTMEWLASKSPEDRHSIVVAARSSVPSIRAENALWKKHLSSEILKRAHEKERERVTMRAAVTMRRMKAVHAVASSGIVTETAEMARLLDPLPPSARVKALRAQIQFRERALMQPPPEDRIYVLSKQGKQISEDELRRRLITLIEDDLRGVIITRSLPSSLIGCDIRRWLADGSMVGRGTEVLRKSGQSLVRVSFPSQSLVFPLGDFEREIEEGSIELIEDLL
ncbi:hypothetical protein PENTCL1PPCAC_4183 [Pristionchus entomophagus]|uniref:Ribosomal protein n=1 Tax=Pristionchus entomophagus TaxID=358040 RepID=A0AAV5SG34_9BILA|nr:hypothetical protein PENTCL1PPCAC_4183 [Pristionchus entomophagus]